MVTALLALESRAEARSTLSARFAYQAIVGPGLHQQAVLYLHYFPGDGEAITRTVLKCPGAVQLKGAQAAGGQVRFEGATIEVSYATSPKAGESIDTLHIDLVAEEMTLPPWSIAIYSSLDPTGAAAHQQEVELEVKPPPAIIWSITPGQVYQG